MALLKSQFEELANYPHVIARTAMSDQHARSAHHHCPRQKCCVTMPDQQFSMAKLPCQHAESAHQHARLARQQVAYETRAEAVADSYFQLGGSFFTRCRITLALLQSKPFHRKQGNLNPSTPTGGGTRKSAAPVSLVQTRSHASESAHVPQRYSDANSSNEAVNQKNSKPTLHLPAEMQICTKEGQQYEHHAECTTEAQQDEHHAEGTKEGVQDEHHAECTKKGVHDGHRVPRPNEAPFANHIKSQGSQLNRSIDMSSNSQRS